MDLLRPIVCRVPLGTLTDISLFAGRLPLILESVWVWGCGGGVHSAKVCIDACTRGRESVLADPLQLKRLSICLSP